MSDTMYKVVMKPVSDNGLPNMDVKCPNIGKTLLFPSVEQANNWIHRNVDNYQKCLYDYLIVEEGQEL